MKNKFLLEVEKSGGEMTTIPVIINKFLELNSLSDKFVGYILLDFSGSVLTWSSNLSEIPELHLENNKSIYQIFTDLKLHKPLKYLESGLVGLKQQVINDIDLNLCFSDSLVWLILTSEINIFDRDSIDKNPYNKNNYHKTEIALNESQIRLKLLLEYMPGILWSTDSNFNITSCSGAELKVINVSEKDLMGKHINSFFKAVQTQQSPDEVHQKAINGEISSFEFMLNQYTLYGYIEPLKNSNQEIIGTIGMAIDISEIKKFERELKDAKVLAETANQSKSIFLSTMSHELRTPMNGIIGISKMLLKYDSDNLTENQIEGLGLIHQSGKRLLNLINDILDLSKIEAGKMNLIYGTVEMDRFLSEIEAIATTLVKEKEIDFFIEKSTKLASKIETDEKLLNQVIMNLIGNAYKFTEEGEVLLKIFPADDKLFFEIIDTGIGISEENVLSIFDEFKQVDSSVSRRYKGTGLGLALAKKLIHLLGGNIEVKSKIDSGTTMRFFIPYEPIR